MIPMKCALCTDRAIEAGATEDSDDIPFAVSIFPVTMNTGEVTQAPLCFACRLERFKGSLNGYEVLSDDQAAGKAVVRWRGRDWDIPRYLLADRKALASYLGVQQNGSGRHSLPVRETAADTWTR